MEASGPVFEFKLNITDSDFIIIADPSLSDSTAVILRSTTVLAYRPDMSDRPFSANLNNAEVFSCQLGGNEEDSALSIIDPVTINFEIAGRNVPGMPSKVRNLTQTMHCAVHRGAFCQYTFRWIHYCHSSKSTGKETSKTHLCDV